MRNLHRPHLVAVVTMALWLSPAVASADEASDAFNRGMKQLGAGRYDAACDAFEEAEQLGGATMKTRYQLGRCNQEQGQHVAAHRAFADVERLATRAGDDKRAAAARQRMKEVGRHVGLLIIDVPQATAALTRLRIDRDGEPVPPRDFGRPVAVEAGSHTVTISAEGHQTLRLKVSAIAPGKSSQLNVPALSEGSGETTSEGEVVAAGGAPLPPALGEAPPPPAPEDEGPGKASPALFWTGLGFVIAGPLLAAAGAYTYVEQDQQAPGIAGMAVGGALLATGIPFMVIGGADAEPEPSGDEAGWSLQPRIGLGQLGLHGSF